MLLFHQSGHNFIWNIDSLVEDKAGDGIIFSPVNVPFKKLVGAIDNSIKKLSYFDPQLYLINQSKGKLSTYEFFPGNIKNNFNTTDLNSLSEEIANSYIDFQNENEFKYLTIPTRYYEQLPVKYYDQFYDYIVEPFIKKYKDSLSEKPLILTIIVKQIQIMDDEQRNSLLNWITSITEINGVYLIFENNFSTKQIKEAGYLYYVLLFMHYLKMNGLQVHIGYNNTEGFLYSILNPDSISMGTYENLRSFNIKRFEKRDKNKQNPPRARLYISSLLQWIDYGYISAIRLQYSNAENIFEDSKYKPELFEPSFNWHFQKPQPYKHFFIIFNQQIKSVPLNAEVRFDYVESAIKRAIKLFEEINESGILLDENSDGSHLYFWLTAFNMFKNYKLRNPDEFSY